MNYRSANEKDIGLLVQSRLEFTYGMRGVEIDVSGQRYSELQKNCYQYFNHAIDENTCDVILAEEDGKCVGTGMIFYYFSVPSSFNIEGKNAYITSLYVKPEYREKGIGSTILDMLIQKAKSRGYEIVMLNASDMGRKLYEKVGFKDIKKGMILDGRGKQL